QGVRASHLERMKVTLKAFVLTLALQVTAGSLLSHGQLLPSPTTQARAGCHQHSHQAPSPQPKSYVCCVNGHDAAILSASSIVGPSGYGEVVGAGIETHTTCARVPVVGPLSSLSPGDPPVIPALRI